MFAGCLPVSCAPPRGILVADRQGPKSDYKSDNRNIEIRHKRVCESKDQVNGNYAGDDKSPEDQRNDERFHRLPSPCFETVSLGQNHKFACDLTSRMKSG
jgi:hypothetical protein